MLYSQNVSDKNFLKKLEGYQKEYKKLVNDDFCIIKLNNSNSKEPKPSLYDILFEPKYDSVLDFFQGKQK